MSARHFLCAALVVSIAAPAGAEPLVLDELLLADAAGVLARAADVGALPNLEQAQTAPSPERKRKSSSVPESTSSPSSGGSSLSGFGIGLQVGTPTALTLKLGAGGGADIVLGIGAGYAYRGGGFGLSLHGDYLFTVATLIPDGAVNATAYVGPGLWLTLFSGGYGYGVGYYYARNDFIGIGARFPLGINAKFAAAPVEVYLELDPALFIFPGIDIFIGASLGFRWFF